jgi:hypothetical protein
MKKDEKTNKSNANSKNVRKKDTTSKGSMHEHSSRPFVTYKLTLNSDKAQKAFEKSYDQASMNLFVIENMADSVMSPENKEELDKLVDSMFAKIEDDMTDEIRRAQKLLDNESENLLEDEDEFVEIVDHTKPRVFKAKVNTPLARRYIALLRKLDSVVSMIDSLWLNGCIEAKVRKTRSYGWRNRIFNLSFKLRGAANKVREARNLKHAAEQKEGGQQKPAAATPKPASKVA